MRLKDLNGTHTFQVPLPANAATDASLIAAVWRAPYKFKITAIYHRTGTAVTGDGTNTRNLNAQLQAGTEIANLDYGAGISAAKTADKAFTISGTTAQCTLAEGDALCIQNEKIGTGQALAPGAIIIQGVPLS